jgi:serine/threonine protein kinase
MKDLDRLRRAIKDLDGDFELLREIGRGATAVVYLLRDRTLDRDVAMKVIRASFGADQDALARLHREARLVAQLTHPNIVKLYGTHSLSDGSFALLMEHVPGRNLKEILREEGAFSPRRAVEVLKDVGSALAYAHRRRIVHRDVKPENIYIDEEVGAARLADFGVARPWDQDARLTLPGASLGTPAYMSPEQIDGAEVDGRTDVYSLGLVGYELLLGQHPWEGENVFTIIYRQKHDKLRMDVLGLGEHPVLAGLLEKALEKDPTKRWESAAAFLEELIKAESEAVAADAALPAPGIRPETASPGAVSRTETREGARAPEPGGDTTSGSRSAPDDPKGLPPVDWAVVEPQGFGGPGDAGPGASAGPEDVELEDHQEASNGMAMATGAPMVVANGRRKPWGRALVMGTLLLVGGFWGAYRWTPLGDWFASLPLPFSLSTTPVFQEGPSPSPASEAAPEPGSLAFLGEGVGEVTVGSTIPILLQALGAEGSPLQDTLIRMEVIDGEGDLDFSQVRTDASGRAQATLRVPSSPGRIAVSASVSGEPKVQTLLELDAVPGPPSQVIILVGDGQTAPPGSMLPEFLGVRVRDDFANPLVGTEVRFQVGQGGGRVSPALARTDDQGRAFARWTLGAEEGTQMAVAVVSGAEDRLLTFQASARTVEPDAPSLDQPRDPEPDRRPEPGDTAGTARPSAVAVVSRTYALGGSHGCHLVGGSPRCRGANDRGQDGEGAIAGLVAVAAGVSHTCGLDSSGLASCWGANEAGQLGDGTTLDRRPAAAVATDARFSVLAAGLSHTCGLTAGGQVACWGRNASGQLGDGTRQDHFVPAPAAGGQSFRDLLAGWNHTCGLTAGGQALCWGSNARGQVGDGSRVDRLAPTRVQGSFQSLAAGANHTCGISGNEVLCWGDNGFGQLGDGTNENRTSPVSVQGLPGAPLALAAGAVHTCAVLSDRSAWCWGQNLHGQVGDGTNTHRNTPTPVEGELSFLTVFGGGGATCGFTRNGEEYCWGLNQSGQLGDGTRTNRSVPTRVIQ